MASTSELVRVRTPYVEPEEAAALIASAITLVRHLRTIGGVHPRHRKDLISIALWKLTEASGERPSPKYNVRFCSEGVVQAKDSGVSERVNHEHVHTRDEIARHVLRAGMSDEDLERYVRDRSQACIVTYAEHALLGQTRKSGWSRYEDVGIRVWDRALQDYVDPASLAEGAPAVVTERAPARTVVDADPLGRLAGPQAERLRRIADLVGELGAVVVPPRKGDARYLLVYDTDIEEPTKAVAYLNYSGKSGGVDVLLDLVDVPPRLREEPSVGERSNVSGYRVRCTVDSERSMWVAERLVNLAVNRLRRDHRVE